MFSVYNAYTRYNHFLGLCSSHMLIQLKNISLTSSIDAKCIIHVYCFFNSLYYIFTEIFYSQIVFATIVYSLQNRDITSFIAQKQYAEPHSLELGRRSHLGLHTFTQ